MLAIKPHPFVLKLRGTFQDADHLYMLTELCQVHTFTFIYHLNTRNESAMIVCVRVFVS
jgi:hypothetical protein